MGLPKKVTPEVAWASNGWHRATLEELGVTEAERKALIEAVKSGGEFYWGYLRPRTYSILGQCSKIRRNRVQFIVCAWLEAEEPRIYAQEKTRPRLLQYLTTCVMSKYVTKYGTIQRGAVPSKPVMSTMLEDARVADALATPRIAMIDVDKPTREMKENNMFGTQSFNKKQLIKVLEDNAKAHEKAVVDDTKKAVEILQSEARAFADDRNGRTFEIPSCANNSKTAESLRDKIAVLNLLSSDSVTLTDGDAGKALSMLITATEPRTDTVEIAIHCD